MSNSYINLLIEKSLQTVRDRRKKHQTESSESSATGVISKHRETLPPKALHALKKT